MKEAANQAVLLLEHAGSIHWVGELNYVPQRMAKMALPHVTMTKAESVLCVLSHLLLSEYVVNHVFPCICLSILVCLSVSSFYVKCRGTWNGIGVVSS